MTSWLVRPLSVGIADPKCVPTTDIVIINYDIIHKFKRLLEFYWDLVICDEVQRAKNSKARCTKAVMGWRPNRKQKAEGEVGSSGIPARRRIVLTGTPLENGRPIELWPILHWLDPKRFSNMMAFAIAYCGATRTQHGWDFSGATNLGQLQKLLRSTVMIRRKKSEVLTELPPKTRKIVELDSTGFEDLIAREKKQAEDTEDRMIELRTAVELAKVGDDEQKYRAAIAQLSEFGKTRVDEMAELRQQTALAKVPQVCEHLEQAIEDGLTMESGGKIIVFAHHRAVLEQLHRNFRDVGVLFYGGMSPEEKQRAVDSFQRDPKTRVFFGSIGAAGTAITLHAGDRVCFVEEDWVPGRMTQAEDRAHRFGQRNAVLVEHLVFAGSLDVYIAQTSIKKQERIDRALDLEPEEADEPVTLTAAVSASKREIEKEAQAIRPESIPDIHQAIRTIARLCDGARTLDTAGFSKIDLNIGHSLARALMLTPKQAVIARKIALKYRRQLPAELAARLEAKQIATNM